MIEKIDTGEIKTAFLKFGEQVKIEVLDAAGKSIFGSIEQKLVQYAYRKKAA
jgi:fumarylacetoacetate (FAA) hydrolase